MKKTVHFDACITSRIWLLPVYMYAFSARRWASSTTKVSKVAAFVCTNEPAPLKRFDTTDFLKDPVSLLSYTARGAAFLETYCASRPRLVNSTKRLIAMTDFPVPGPPLTITTFFFIGVA